MNEDPFESPDPTEPEQHPAGTDLHHPASRGRRRTPVRHGRQRRTGRVVFPAIGGVLAMALVLTGGYAAWSYAQLDDSLTKVHVALPHASSSPDADGAAQNILLVGDDHRPADATPQELAELGTQLDGGATNTDSMIVLHIPAGGGSATMISFPRDSWVQIPGHGTFKLNSAFSDGAANGGGDAGGMRLLMQTIENMSGLTIDHFVRVSLLGFYQLVKALGPVQVCLNEAVHDTNSNVDLPAGNSTLDASQALSFVRQRDGLPRGDLDREVRQQYFLSQEARKALSADTLLNPVKVSNLLHGVGDSIQIDDGLSIPSLVNTFRSIDLSNIRSTAIPTAGTPTIDGYSTVAVDFGAMPAFIQSIVGAPAAYTSAHAAAPSSVHVTVQNGGSTAGGATAASSALTAKGFVVGAPSDTTTTTATVVEYPKGAEAQAKAVANVVPGATAVLSTQVTGVTLVLGTDGHTVTAAGTSGTTSGTTAAGTSGTTSGTTATGTTGTTGTSGTTSGSTGTSSPTAATTANPKPKSTPSTAPVGNAYGDQGACIN
ncbi:LCP family protein [Curtobacterium sp. MCPF17_002]|uniref:LCP family protein n=1 Tax=Curtobacterium sp. MCPF17_002 TaxID=2175645 RepID=UPI000DAA648E|nr:LCP family protein [Curtobacterium sp. MCPF17_002]WIB77488.1 LCP family protein [Curtobacterium sp. MCPF17_002]